MGQIYEFIPPQRKIPVQEPEVIQFETNIPQGENSWADRSIRIAWCFCIFCLLVWAAILAGGFALAVYKGSVVLFGNGYVGIAGLVATVVWLFSVGRRPNDAPSRLPMHPLITAPRRLYVVSSRDEPLREPPDDFRPAA